MSKFAISIKVLILSIFLVFPTLVKAHFDMLVSQHKQNVFVEMKVGFFEFETYNKIYLLLELSQKLVEKSAYNKHKVFIKIDNRYTSDILPSYQIGYGKFSFRDEQYKEYEGFTILIKSNDLDDIPTILQIISTILPLKNHIKSTQKLSHKEEKRFDESKVDSFYSVDAQQIQKYVEDSNILVNSILEEKFFVQREINQKRELSYYYQNGKFHFTTFEDQIYVYNKNTPYLRQEKDTLIINDIVEILGNAQDGYLLFNTYNSFYYLNTRNGKVKGEFKIENVSDITRQPVKDYFFDSGYRRFTFYINDYDTIRQVLFIPDSNFIYPNYQTIVTKNIDSLIKFSKTEGQGEEKFKNINYFEIAFYSALGIILILLILFWLQKRK